MVFAPDMKKAPDRLAEGLGVVSVGGA